jgi:hypothetical protein
VKWRIYYSEDDDVPWSVDDGDTQHEICVKQVRFDGVTPTAETPLMPRSQPKAWIEVDADLTIESGCAVFKAPPVTQLRGYDFSGGRA